MNPLDYGLDLERAKRLPECCVCRKKSDGALTVFGFTFCGAHGDAAMAHAKDWPGAEREAVEAWAAVMRAGAYRGCWEARDDE